jgi:signal transduction histidine kinase
LSNASATKWLRLSCAAIFLLWPDARLIASGTSIPQATNVIEIQSVAVNGQPAAWSRKSRLRVSPKPRNISFTFGAASQSGRSPIRTRFKLEGYDSNWRESGGEMFLMLRFYNSAGDAISQKSFTVGGDSPGWTGELKTSPLTHRRETLVVPPNATQVWAILSSAGPPATVGIYVVDNLVISKLAPDGGNVLLHVPFQRGRDEDLTNQIPQGWIRDGLRPSMARIVELGSDSMARAFAILDDDPNGHAEWHTIKEFAPAVSPGDRLEVEWNELFSVGVGNGHEATYEQLAPGDYRFRVAEVSALGVPTGLEAFLDLRVPVPVWEMPWFWAAVAAFLMAGLMMLGRYRAWRKMRYELLLVESQRALEQERLRIARDIHDDLGARVTQISLFSAMAQNSSALSDRTRDDFGRISQMAREMVSALYETVWAVNPENDNLDALGNYLCQMINQLCDQAQLRCRLHVPSLPGEVQLASQMRHDIILAVKEAIHNVIKHARATEVTFHLTFAGNVLTISVHDNGVGFTASAHPAGHGLINMKRRLENLGGSCVVESEPGVGTTITLCVTASAGDLEKVQIPE